MQGFLLKKLSEISEDEKRILNGENVYREVYEMDGDFVISAENIGSRDVSISRHMRFAPFPTHRHNYIEMMIVLSGSITHRIDGREIRLKTGDALFLNKHISHSIDLAGEEDIGVNLILSDGFIGTVLPMLGESVFSNFIKESSRPSGTAMYLHFSTGGKKQIENLTENIIFELTDEHADADIITRTLALLLRYLSTESDSLLIGANIPETAESKRKKIISAYLKSNYKSASLVELAGRLYLSAPYLSRLVLELFGKSFKALVIDERMRCAMTLILESSMPINEIISGVGYENASYFHREFKKRFGMTPLSARKNKKTPSMVDKSASVCYN